MNEKIEGSLSQGPKRDKELLKKSKNSIISKKERAPYLPSHKNTEQIKSCEKRLNTNISISNYPLNIFKIIAN